MEQIVKLEREMSGNQPTGLRTQCRAGQISTVVRYSLSPKSWVLSTEPNASTPGVFTQSWVL